jgi:hypothetical protein
MDKECIINTLLYDAKHIKGTTHYFAGKHIGWLPFKWYKEVVVKAAQSIREETRQTTKEE